MKTILKPSQSEIKIKKSQFICRLFPTKTKEESKKIIQEISEKYKDATHNCTAYITSNGEKVMMIMENLVELLENL